MMRIAFARYKRDQAFKVLRGNGRFVLGMTTGSIACALILGIVANLVLIPPLPCSS
jgi:uncharacterized protein